MELDILHNFQKYVFSAPYSSWLLQGVYNTLYIALITTFLSLLLGIIIGSCRISKHPFLSIFSLGYIHLFRNIPVVPFLLLLTIGLPNIYLTYFKIPLPRNLEFYFLIAVISLNSSAYIAEIIRSGFRAIPCELLDSAQLLGLSNIQIQKKIIAPLVFRQTFPALGNRLIHNLQNSALAMVIPLPLTMQELLGQAKRIEAQTFSSVAPYLFATAVYLIFALTLGGIIRWLNYKIRPVFEVDI